MTSTPLPRSHSIHRSASASAQSNRSGGSRTGAEERRTSWSWASISRISSSYSASRRVSRLMRRFSWRTTWVSATPSDRFARSLSTGAQAGSMPVARQLPAAWQESIKQGRKWSYRRFLDRCERGNSWFYRAFDVPSVLGTWGAGLPPERVHVLTVPRSGATDGDSLWLRFCRATGIDPAWAPVDSERANRSLGVAETQVVRQLNRRIKRATRREAEYDELIREMLAQDQLVPRARGVAGLAAPVLAEQVERRPELEQLR